MAVPQEALMKKQVTSFAAISMFSAWLAIADAAQGISAAADALYCQDVYTYVSP